MVNGLLFKIFDKKDDFNFPIVNLPFICSNIPAAPAYGVYISQLIRYYRACGTYQDFLDIVCCANKEATEPRVPLSSVEVSLRNLNGRHHDLFDRYDISLLQRTTDMFHLW